MKKRYPDDVDIDEQLEAEDKALQAIGDQAANVLIQLVESTEETSEYMAGYFRGQLAAIDAWLGMSRLMREEVTSAVEAYCKQVDEEKK